ncbi:unnamed protein product, partial [Strongylus vulgaris]
NSYTDRFEPGEANEEFDVDYSKEFTAEKKKRKGVKRAAEQETGEDDEIDLVQDEEEEEDDIDEEENEEDEEEEISEDDEDVEMESESDEEGKAPIYNRANNDFGDSDLSDDERGGNDADAAGEKFASLLEDFEEEDENTKTNKKGKRKWRKSKALKNKRK